MRYQNDFFYYIWKPHGIPSTYGSRLSFLEELIYKRSHEIDILQQERDPPSSKGGWDKIEDSELGLVNRLDNETAGLLFFAKNKIIFDEYKKLQSEGKIQKIYYAQLHGQVINSIEQVADIYHHHSDPSKMTLDPKLGKGKPISCKTIIEPIEYDPDTNSTTCRVIITKGCRHQIRVHTSSIGHHIIGDQLYCPKSFKSDYQSFYTDSICLWSMGIDIHS